MSPFEKSKKKRRIILKTQPIELASKFLGLNLSSPFGKLYSLLLFIIFCVTTFTSSADICLTDCTRSFIKDLILWVKYCTTTVLVWTVLVISFFRPIQFTLNRKELVAIDELLRSYNTNFPRTQSFGVQSVQIFLSISVPLIVSAKYVFYLIRERTLHVASHYISYYFSTTVCIVTDFLFIDIMYMIRQRFKEINGLIIRQGRKKQPAITFVNFLSHPHVSDNNNEQIVAKNIQTLRYLYHQLYEFAVEVNVDFGLHLLISSLMSFLIITDELYEIHENFFNNKNSMGLIVLNALGALSYVVRLLVISSVCEHTTNESRSTATILHDHFSGSRQGEITYFSIQTIHEKLLFTAFGFYEINFGISCSIFGAVTTYLVILIQTDILNSNKNNSSTSYAPNVTYMNVSEL